jgi:hypothetical protein
LGDREYLSLTWDIESSVPLFFSSAKEDGLFFFHRELTAATAPVPFAFPALAAFAFLPATPVPEA